MYEIFAIKDIKQMAVIMDFYVLKLVHSPTNGNHITCKKTHHTDL